MAKAIKLSSEELVAQAQKLNDLQTEGMLKDADRVNEQLREVSSDGRFSALSKELARMSEGIAPLAKDLHDGIFTLKDSIAKRLLEMPSLDVHLPGGVSAEIAAMYDTSLKAQLDKMPSVQLESLVRDITGRHDMVPISPPRMLEDHVDYLASLAEEVKPVGEVVSEAVSGIAERMGQRLREDAAATQNQLAQVASIMENLVKITIQSSKDSAAANRKSTVLAVIMVVAAIAQCVIMLWPSVEPWLVRHPVK